MPPPEIETFFIGVDASPGFAPAVVIVAVAAASHRIPSGSALFGCAYNPVKNLSSIARRADSRVTQAACIAVAKAHAKTAPNAVLNRDLIRCSPSLRLYS